jgi:putative transposase
VPYWRTFYHLVWATRTRQPLIAATMQDRLQQSIRATGQEHYALVHAVGVMPDHVHVAVSIAPSVAVSTLVGRLKGSSRHLLNNLGKTPNGVQFTLQAEYGVLSFDEKDLPQVVNYVENRAACHAANRLSVAMETIVEDLQPAEAGFVG